MGNFTFVREGWGKLNRKCKVSNGFFFFGRRIRPRGKEPDFYSIRRFLENLSILRGKKEICGYFLMNLKKNCFIFFATLLQILMKC